MPPTKRAATSPPQAVIALDIGGTKLASCLFVDQRKPLAKRAVPLAGREDRAVGALAVREIRRLDRAAARRGLATAAIGVCVPGIVRARTGRVWAPNIPGWDDYPLRAELRDALANSRVKVVVESDRAAAILGEVWQGAARGCRNAVFLAVGTGIGAGVLVDGHVLRGAHDIAGAIGWLALDRPFRSDYSQCGCFECHASGHGIASRVNATLARRTNYRGPLRTKRRLAAPDVFAAFERGDPLAKDVLADAVQFWGMASANLVSLFNPELIVFGGGIFGPARQFIEAIAAEARRWAQPIAIEQARFEASQLGGDAALYGAAYAALRRARPQTP